MSNYPSYPPAQPAAPTSTLAIVSLVAGVLGWLGILVVGPIIAVVTGHMAKNEIRSSNGMIGGDGLATAGLVLGYVNLAMTVLGICLFIILPLLGLGGLGLCVPFLNQINTVP
ncbi:MAG TPA: DUF4190 domain-containing protein [Anaerolineaceae bacterium]|jgi:hypothetical protein|nr:DUF4190 domain-containing protein [Anaerolineaceae bacterium]